MSPLSDGTPSFSWKNSENDFDQTWAFSGLLLNKDIFLYRSVNIGVRAGERPTDRGQHKGGIESSTKRQVGVICEVHIEVL
jgi:hypothetical protein